MTRQEFEARATNERFWSRCLGESAISLDLYYIRHYNIILTDEYKTIVAEITKRYPLLRLLYLSS